MFSYHAFAPVLERAEGIYLYDTEGNRYIDASGGPIAMNIAHGDRRVIEAHHPASREVRLLSPGLSNQPRAEVCARIARLAPGNLQHHLSVFGWIRSSRDRDQDRSPVSPRSRQRAEERRDWDVGQLSRNVARSVVGSGRAGLSQTVSSDARQLASRSTLSQPEGAPRGNER